METLDTVKERIKCDCKCHEISIEASWEQHQNAKFCDCYLAFWQMGRFDGKWPWLQRFKMIWNILKEGHCYSDMVILNASERRKLYETMKKIVAIDEKHGNVYQ
jgi:hypothetical protein